MRRHDGRGHGEGDARPAGVLRVRSAGAERCHCAQQRRQRALRGGSHGVLRALMRTVTGCSPCCAISIAGLPAVPGGALKSVIASRAAGSPAAAGGAGGSRGPAVARGGEHLGDVLRGELLPHLVQVRQRLALPARRQVGLVPGDHRVEGVPRDDARAAAVVGRVVRLAVDERALHVLDRAGVARQAGAVVGEIRCGQYLAGHVGRGFCTPSCPVRRVSPPRHG